MTLQELQEVLLSCPALRQARVRSVNPMMGDASSRSYFRVFMDEPAGMGKGAPAPSLIVLRYGDAKGPAFRQPSLPTQEEAMRVLADELRASGIPVPLLYFHHAEKRMFVFEDCGDRPLSALATGRKEALVDTLFDRFGPQWIESLFRQALDIVVRLQVLPPESSKVAFRRWLEFENYRREAQEFLDFVAEPRGVSKGGREVILAQLDALSETIVSFPKTLSHFDFHGHNILIRDDGSLVVIDFQDACLTTAARDIVSLLNDRGMDEVLGASAQARLYQYFVMQRAKFSPEGAFVANFPHIYNTTLLHWDLRVSGRFHKLNKEKKTDRYQQWIPGTLRRLGRTLARAHREIHGMDRLLEVVLSLSPEAREGVNDPWSLPMIGEPTAGSV